MKQIMIDIDEGIYIRMGTEGVSIPESEKIYDAILNGISLPENATNGDVIKALFPNYYYMDDKDINTVSLIIDIIIKRVELRFDKEWWCLPYKKGRCKK